MVAVTWRYVWVAVVAGLLIFFLALPLCSVAIGLWQMRVGQSYLRGIGEADVPVWIERSERYLSQAEVDPTMRGIGAFGNPDQRPVPDDLKELGIVRVDIVCGDESMVDYLWLGGMDHTYLEVERMNEGGYRLTAVYSDEPNDSRVIWEGIPQQSVEGG